MKKHILMLSGVAASALSTGCSYLDGISKGAQSARPIFSEGSQISQVDIAAHIRKYADVEIALGASVGNPSGAGERTTTTQASAGLRRAGYTPVVDTRNPTASRPTLPHNLQFRAEEFTLEDALFEFAVSVTDDTKKKSYRNEIVSLAIVSADKSCGDYLNTLRVEQSNSRTAFQLLNQGVNVAGAITQNLGTSNLMSAFSGVFTSAGETVDKNLFATAGSELVSFEVAEQFDLHRDEIVDKFDLAYAKWPLGLALADVEAMAQDCDLRTGLASVQKKVTSAATIERAAKAEIEKTQAEATQLVSQVSDVVATNVSVAATEAVDRSAEALVAQAILISQETNSSERAKLLADFKVLADRQSDNVADKIDEAEIKNLAIVEALNPVAVDLAPPPVQAETTAPQTTEPPPETRDQTPEL